MKLFAVALAVLAARATFIEIVSDQHTVQLLDGEPVGKMVDIEGTNTYVTLPKNGPQRPKEALLFLTDIFGVQLVNSRLLADQFASKGIATFIPDYLFGDPVPVDMTGFNLTAWQQRHTEAITTPFLLNAIKGLRKQGVRRFAATGYCFGGLYVLRLTQNNTIVAGTTAHPSALNVPEDFLLVRSQSHVPLQIHSAELDTALTQALAATVDDVMHGTGDFTDLGGPYKFGYQRINHLGVGHGFAVRPANASDPVQIEAMQEAFEEAAAFVRRHL